MKSLLLVLPLFIACAANCADKDAAQTPKMPPILKSKGDQDFRGHFNMIMDQIRPDVSKHAIVLNQKADTLESAYALLVQKSEKDRKYTACIEYKDWYLISDTGLVEGWQNNLDEITLSIVFHSGVAIKKGDIKAYHFGFW